MHKGFLFTLTVSFFGLILLFSSERAVAQTSIEVTIKGLSKDSCSIAYHFGDKQYVKGKFYIDAAGSGTFKSTETLKEGIYMLVFPNRSYLEILMHGEDFKISVDASNMKDCIFEGSKENQLFQSYIAQVSSLGKKRQEIESSTSDESIRMKKMGEVDDEMSAFRDKFIADNGGMLVSKIVKAMADIHIPESIPADKQYIYLREHLFDNIDFKDEWVMRSPILNNKIEYYIEKLTVQDPDSIIEVVDELVEKVTVNDELFKYTVITLLNKYAQSKTMFAANVYVHIVQQYYLTGRAVWATDQQLEKMKDRELNMRNNILGVQAKDVELHTLSEKNVRMSEIRSEYLVLFFWDPDCDHCLEIGDQLAQFYKKYHSKGVKILGLCTDPEKDKMEEAVIQHSFTWTNGIPVSKQVIVDYDVYSTPLIYLLDKERKVVARRIDVASLTEFISYELGEEN